MGSIFQGGGYLLVDHSASGGQREEYDTHQCPHCEQVFRLERTTIHREAFCTQCNRRVCPRAACATVCNPFMRRIEVALRTLLAGRTAFIIAHRLSTISDADLIVVLEHGRIVEQGSHTELLARRGLYTSLYGDWAADVA